MLEEYLERLNDIVDPEHVAQAEARMTAAVSCLEVDRLPLTVACPASDWPSFTYREGFEDPEKMLFNELAAVWAGAHVRDDRMYTIRANYGVGIIPSMFGCRINLVDDHSMPWVEHLDDERLDRVLEAGSVDIGSGLGARVLETEEFFLEKLSPFENLRRCVHVFCCDTQGPFDIAHLVMGTKIYTEIYDNPGRVRRLLELATDAHIRFTLEQKRIIGEDISDGFHYHQGMKIRGSGRICDDSSTNLSAECYAEFCRTCNERILAELKGGWIHYCGDGAQILSEVLATPGVTGLNFGNGEKQDAERVFSMAAERGVAVLGWSPWLPRPDWVRTGVTLSTAAENLEAARRMVTEWSAGAGFGSD